MKLKIRKTGFNAPIACSQASAWGLYIFNALVFGIQVIPYYDSAGQYILISIFIVSLGSVAVLMVLVTISDPTDPICIKYLSSKDS